MVKMIIPSLIVRERPGIISLSLRSQNFDYSNISHDQNKEEKPKITEKDIKKSISTSSNISNLTSSKGESNSNSKSTINQSSKSKSLSSLSSSTQPKKKTGKSKRILKKKTIPNIAIPVASPEAMSSLSASRKTVTWSEPYSDQRENIEAEHERKRKELFENHKKYPSYLKDKDPHKESIERLEKIVTEQNVLVKSLESGLSGSSQGSKYHKTYEELEREIESIKDMLTEKEDKYRSGNNRDESLISDLSYSSDEPKKEENSFEDWLSPRFPEDRRA